MDVTGELNVQRSHEDLFGYEFSRLVQRQYIFMVGASRDQPIYNVSLDISSNKLQLRVRGLVDGSEDMKFAFSSYDMELIYTVEEQGFISLATGLTMRHDRFISTTPTLSVATASSLITKKGELKFPQFVSYFPEKNLYDFGVSGVTRAEIEGNEALRDSGLKGVGFKHEPEISKFQGLLKKENGLI